MEQKSIVLKEVWVPSETPFRFREAQDPTTGEKRFVMGGLMLPFGKISRNNVLYEKSSVMQHHKSLIGRPVMYNHQVEGTVLPVGHYTDSYCVEQPDERHPVAGWYYEADIDPEEKNIIRKVKRGDLRHVSIQLVGGRVFERLDPETNRAYTEAHVADIIEGSIVPAPGFLDTTAKFAEMFRAAEQAGAVIPNTPMTDKGGNPSGEQPAQVTTRENTTGGNPMPNDADKDTQASASIPPDNEKGATPTPSSVGQDKTAQPAKQMQEANDADKDTQAGASIPADKNTDFAKATPDKVGQDETTAARTKDSKMEKSSAKTHKENDDADADDVLEERFKEFTEAYEDDMSKMAEIMERLKEQVDSLKSELDALKPSDGAPAKEAEQEPQPPLSERAKLRNVFTEAINPASQKKSFNDAVRKVLHG